MQYDAGEWQTAGLQEAAGGNAKIQRMREGIQRMVKAPLLGNDQASRIHKDECPHPRQTIWRNVIDKLAKNKRLVVRHKNGKSPRNSEQNQSREWVKQKERHEWRESKKQKTNEWLQSRILETRWKHFKVRLFEPRSIAWHAENEIKY